MEQEWRFIWIASGGDLPKIKELIARGVNPVAVNNQALVFAASNGHLEVVQYLVTLPGVDPSAQDNQAIIMAASRGFLEVVQYLVTLPVVDPAARNNKSIEMAADKEKWDIVRFLASLQGLDPRENNNELFIWLVSENMAVATKGLVKSKKLMPLFMTILLLSPPPDMAITI